jgi:hypothetical protein
MILWLRNSIAGIEKLVKPKRRALDPSRLMGMYLDQANRSTGAGLRGAGSREGQDGKFAQNRRRAVERLP